MLRRRDLPFFSELVALAMGFSQPRVGRCDRRLEGDNAHHQQKNLRYLRLAAFSCFWDFPFVLFEPVMSKPLCMEGLVLSQRNPNANNSAGPEVGENPQRSQRNITGRSFIEDLTIGTGTSARSELPTQLCLLELQVNLSSLPS